MAQPKKKPDEPTPTERLRQALAEPFHPDEIGWLPKSVSGNRALAIAFVTARAVMDRLDDAIGIENWQDDYECLADGNVVCRLSLRIGGEWVTKADVGGASAQPDAGDKCKSSFSDALKRAAVKFGIARYVYHLPKQWCDYDPQKRRFTRTPTLPAWALPGARTPPPPPVPDAPEESQPTATVIVGGQHVAGPAPSEQVAAEQVARIETLLAAKRYDAAAFLGRLAKKYGASSLSMLTAAQAGEVEEALRTAPAAKAS